MPATKRLVLDLPEATVAEIEARVASGEFETASAAVTAAVTVLSPLRDNAPRNTRGDDAWLSEGDEIVARFERGEEPAFPAAQVFDEVRAALRHGGGDQPSRDVKAS